MTLPDPGTDPIPEGGHHQGRSHYGFLATLIGLPKLEHRIKEFLMANLDPISGALDNQTTALGTLATQQQQLATQIAALVAGSVTQAQIDALATRAQINADAITAAARAADASYEPDEGEGEPPVEEPPVEEPPTG